MAIKCSLLGHRFTETEVEEERVEEGSEVVITVREVETCERCGKERVVTENKEVTSLAAEGATETSPDAAGEPTAETPTDVGRDDTSPDLAPDADAAEDDAEFVGESGGDDAATADDQRDVDAMTETEQVAGAGGTDEVDAPDDDAVILDDSETERDPGEWPGDEDEPATETEANTAAVAPGQDASTGASEDANEEWPDEYGYEEESSARADEVDWPEEDEGAGEEWTPTESLTESIDGAEVEAAGTASTTAPDGTFVCPECGFTTSVEESSLRAGDFCPDCRRGSLEHRASDETRKE